MSDLCVLGTGGAVATAPRDNTAFALDLGRTVTLIDCPGSVLQKLRRLGLDPLKVDSLLVTHVHTDHIYGLASLIHSLFLEEGLIRIFGSKESLAFCAEYLDLFRLRESGIRMRTELVPLGAGRRFRINEHLEAEAIRVPHTPASLAYHLFFQQGAGEWIFSGDTPAVPSLFRRAGTASGLVHDCSAPSRFFDLYPELRAMHTSALDLGRLAQEAGVACLIPCHFFGEAAFTAEEVEEEIRRHYRGRLIIPEDLQRIPLAASPGK
jgi:ribonuclease Z